MLNEAPEEIIATEKDEIILNNVKEILKSGKLATGSANSIKHYVVYIIHQSGRQWHAKLSEIMESIGLKPTESDSCTYVDTKDVIYGIYGVVYVDDLPLIE